MSCALAALAFLPWLLYAVLSEKRVPRGVAPEFSLDLARQIVTGLLVSGPAETVRVEPWLPWLYVVLVIAGIVTGLARRRTRVVTLSLALLVLLSPLLIVLALRWIEYFFEVRQVLFLLPFVLILTAAGVTGVAEGAGRLTGSPCWEGRLFAGISAFLALLLIGPLWPASQAAVGTARRGLARRTALCGCQRRCGRGDHHSRSGRGSLFGVLYI